MFFCVVIHTTNFDDRIVMFSYVSNNWKVVTTFLQITLKTSVLLQK
jgi:hypothetical protein